MSSTVFKFLLIAVSLFLVFYYAYTYSTIGGANPPPDIATFEECAAAGYPVMETYPETCRVPGGALYTRITTDAVPKDVIVSGAYTCLPKKNTGGPVTLECAFGLKTDSGYYGLDMSSIQSDKYPMLMGNESVTVEGALVPIEMISTNQWQTYDIIGIIAVEKIIIN